MDIGVEMTKPKHQQDLGVDEDNRFRAMHDDDCDLRVFIDGRVADEALNGPRNERLQNLFRKIVNRWNS